MIGSTVALLQAEPPLERLNILDHGLGLDGKLPSGPRDQGVPIPLDWQGHFGSPSQRRVDHSPQPFQQSRLTGIPDRIADRVGTEPDLAPDRRTQAGELRQGGLSRSCLGARYGGTRHPAGTPQCGTADSRLATSPGDLGPDASVVLRGNSARPGDGSATGRHGAGSSRRPLHSRLLAHPLRVTSMREASSRLDGPGIDSSVDERLVGRAMHRRLVGSFDATRTGCANRPRPRATAIRPHASAAVSARARGQTARDRGRPS